jgi:ferric-dicitrate binding protein FerR (iron transport regulator)
MNTHPTLSQFTRTWMAKDEEIRAAYQRIEELEDALRNAGLQIEYLHGKFQPTGTSETELARIDHALNGRVQ